MRSYQEIRPANRIKWTDFHLGSARATYESCGASDAEGTADTPALTGVSAAGAVAGAGAAPSVHADGDI